MKNDPKSTPTPSAPPQDGREAVLYEKLDGQAVRCGLCGHACVIADGKYGRCRVRENVAGVLMSRNYGRLVAVNADPIEKKPLFHVLPGSRSLSVAAAGCNFQCDFCQNWQISQSPREGGPLGGQTVSPEQIVTAAASHGCRSISYTYTEPTVFFELAYDTARLARSTGVPPVQPHPESKTFLLSHDRHGLEARATHGRDAHATPDAGRMPAGREGGTPSPRGLLNCFVSNGFLTPQAVETIGPWLDAINVDLKAFRDDTYRRVMKARLEPVLTALRTLAAAGIWLEITTLVVPGMNDSDAELRDIAAFIATELGPHVPWHVSRFHGDYRMTSTPATPARTLQRAREIGIEAGLYYVYTGNAPNPNAESTHCPRCRRLLIDRSGFTVRENTIVNGTCPACGRNIEGIW